MIVQLKCRMVFSYLNEPMDTDQAVDPSLYIKAVLRDPVGSPCVCSLRYGAGTEQNHGPSPEDRAEKPCPTSFQAAVQPPDVTVI